MSPQREKRSSRALAWLEQSRSHDDVARPRRRACPKVPDSQARDRLPTHKLGGWGGRNGGGGREEGRTDCTDVAGAGTAGAWDAAHGASQHPHRSDTASVSDCRRADRHGPFGTPIGHEAVVGADRGPRQGDPRDPRQRRHPQTSEGARLARPASALNVPLHPNLGLVAQRGRGLLLSAHPSSAAARLPHRCRRPAGGDQTLHRRAQPERQTIRLDQARHRYPRCRQPIP